MWILRAISAGWLNELAFAPVDYSPTAAVDEWSGDIGCGSQYFSQQCVFRLAPAAGIQLPGDVTDAEKLAFVQEKLDAGHEGAVKIWQSMGIYLGYALAHYARFYDIRHVLILGRCTSGSGGKLILDGANRVLQAANSPNWPRLSTFSFPTRKAAGWGSPLRLPACPRLFRKTGDSYALSLKPPKSIIPDGLPVEQALARTTHMAISAHQDDIEIMAAAPILECFQREDLWFTGVVVTDGRGSPRDEIYKNFNDEEMCVIRFKEQKKAAVVGEYAAQALLDYPSKTIKDADQPAAGGRYRWPAAGCAPQVRLYP